MTLHQEMHEEVYGLPTPRKKSSKESVAPTEIDQTPDVQTVHESDAEDDGEPSGQASGTHKDHM